MKVESKFLKENIRGKLCKYYIESWTAMQVHGYRWWLKQCYKPRFLYNNFFGDWNQFKSAKSLKLMSSVYQNVTTVFMLMLYNIDRSAHVNA